MIQPKIHQIWKNKASGDRVKVLKLLPGHVKVIDTEGSNQGNQFEIPIHKFQTDYILIR